MNSRTNKPNPRTNSHDNSNNPQRHGLPCGVCGEPVSVYGFKLCNRCHKVLCVKHRMSRIEQSDLPPQFKRGKNIRFVEFCPDCYQEIEEEEQEKREEEQEKQREYEEEIANRVVNQCSLCTANDAWDGEKTFPSGIELSFHCCQRCGRLVCSGCLISVYDPYYEYDIVCKECYAAKEQEDARKREEHWREREEEENELED